jgi:hypothetical protein
MAEAIQRSYSTGHLYFMVNDDTHSGLLEEHQTQLAVHDARTGQPSFFLLQCAMGMQKSAREELQGRSALSDI